MDGSCPVVGMSLDRLPKWIGSFDSHSNSLRLTSYSPLGRTPHLTGRRLVAHDERRRCSGSSSRTSPHAQAHLVGLSAKQLRVDRPHEGVHAIEAFGSGSARQPFEITVRTRDVTVRAGCDVND